MIGTVSDIGAGAWPPCIRVIVSDSDKLDPGSLIIVTCTGATVGREKDQGHAICIPDINVSKVIIIAWCSKSCKYLRLISYEF